TPPGSVSTAQGVGKLDKPPKTCQAPPGLPPVPRLRIDSSRSPARSRASPTSRVTSRGNGTPLAAHSLGYMLIGVNPGIVLTSLIQTDPSDRRTEKATRGL